MTREAKGTSGRGDYDPDRYLIDAQDAGWRMTPERYLAREIRRLLPNCRDVTMSWTVQSSEPALQRYEWGDDLPQLIFGTRNSKNALLHQLDNADSIRHVAWWAKGETGETPIEAVFAVSFRCSR